MGTTKKAVKKAAKKTTKKKGTVEKVVAKVKRTVHKMAAVISDPTISAAPFNIGKVVSRKFVKFDRQFAANFVQTTDKLGYERPTTETWILMLRLFMRTHSFNYANTVIAIVEFKGVVSRLNGQQTCHARAALNDDYVPEILFVKYKVETELELRELYRTFDTGKVRSNKHITATILFGTEHLIGMAKLYLNRLASAYKAYSLGTWGGFKCGAHAEICNKMKTKQIAKVMWLIVAVLKVVPKGFKHRFPTHVVSAMFASFSAHPKQAAVFWLQVANNETGVRNSPVWYLCSYLDSVIARDDGSKHPDKLKVGQEAIYRTCVACFNAMLDNVLIDHELHIDCTEQRPVIN